MRICIDELHYRLYQGRIHKSFEDPERLIAFEFITIEEIKEFLEVLSFAESKGCGWVGSIHDMVNYYTKGT